MSTSAILDLILLVYLALNVFRGYRRGFVVNVLGLVGFLVGLYLGLKLSPRILDYLSTLAHTSIPRSLLSIAVIVAVAFVTKAIVMKVGAKLRKLMIFTPVRWLDSLLGAVISLAIALSFIYVLTAVIEETAPTNIVSVMKKSEFLAQVASHSPRIIDELLRRASAQLR